MATLRGLRIDTGFGANVTVRDVAKILCRVLREAGGDHQDREAIEEGVADAIAGHKPRW